MDVAKCYREGSEMLVIEAKEAGKRYRRRKTTAVAKYYRFGCRSIIVTRKSLIDPQTPKNSKTQKSERDPQTPKNRRHKEVSQQ